MVKASLSLPPKMSKESFELHGPPMGYTPQKDFVESLNNYLPLKLPPWNSPRWNVLTGLLEAALQSKTKLPTQTINLLKGIAHDPNEPASYRCFVSFYLFMFDMGGEPAKYVYLNQALQFYHAVESIERCKSVKIFDLTDVDESFDFKHKISTIGEELDELRKRIETEIEYARDPLQFMKNIGRKSNLKDPDNFVTEIMKLYSSEHFNCSSVRALEVTSSLIDQVKSLPEKKEMTVYIFADKDRIIDREAKRVYRVFTMDIKKLEKLAKKKRHRAFRQMKVSITGCEHSVQKIIVGTFASACLHPFALIPGSKGEPPFRPGKVLLEDNHDAKHPQVKSFLNMMGCSRVDIVDSGISVKVAAEKDAVQFQASKSIVDNMDGIDLPYLSALSHGYTCMNCGKSNMNIKQCPCKKAYFCNKDCQAAQWDVHKKEHKRIMERRQK